MRIKINLKNHEGGNFAMKKGLDLCLSLLIILLSASFLTYCSRENTEEGMDKSKEKPVQKRLRGRFLRELRKSLKPGDLLQKMWKRHSRHTFQPESMMII